MQTLAPWAQPDPLPMPIETGRTILRWFVSSDAQALHEAVSEDRDPTAGRVGVQGA